MHIIYSGSARSIGEICELAHPMVSTYDISRRFPITGEISRKVYVTFTKPNGTRGEQGPSPRKVSFAADMSGGREPEGGHRGDTDCEKDLWRHLPGRRERPRMRLMRAKPVARY